MLLDFWYTNRYGKICFVFNHPSFCVGVNIRTVWEVLLTDNAIYSKSKSIDDLDNDLLAIQHTMCVKYSIVLENNRNALKIVIDITIVLCVEPI